ncbi:MAG: hypothetical protein H3C41_00135 [Bacteroidales bacterium]|nr:hypothetical protein [Bacteroidales bacterium]
MKTILLFFVLLALTVSCQSTKKTTTIPTPASTEISVEADSLHHEILILDPEFDRWYLSRFSPAADRSNEFYLSMNRLGISNWNHYYNTGRYQRVISNYIDYQPFTDYGIEVNRKLYWYFSYIEEKFRIPLLR